MRSVSVVGATGYTGAETLRWLHGHPDVKVVGATSRKHAGKRIGDVWPQLHGWDVPVTEEPPAADVTFLCVPHGEAAKYAGLPGVVIDLSADHRHAPGWLYGLPELGLVREGATRIANPGCFATAIALALLPMRDRLSHVTVVGLTGSTGSGASPSETTHHPMRDENLRAYKVLTHQHVPEVVNALGEFRLDFVPISAPLRRGILVTANLGASLDEYRDFYAGNPLVRVTDAPPEVLHVLGTPRADVGVVNGVVFCAIDNLCRGAGSQAVSNLNLAMGWPVDHGLRVAPPVP
ncbi:MAG: N-acetyl-gamma-glutamyl-phosphate reductase [Myxococcota bacterium]